MFHDLSVPGGRGLAEFSKGPELTSSALRSTINKCNLLHGKEHCHLNDVTDYSEKHFILFIFLLTIYLIGG